MPNCNVGNPSKRRRLNSTNSDDDTVALVCSPRLFRNKRIYVHHTVKLCRRDVLHNLINKYGGELTLVPDDRTTHILVDEGISSRSLLRSLGWTAYPPFVDVLLLNWLSASIKANRCVDPIPFEIRSTHRRYYVSDYIDIEAENAAASTTTDHNSSLAATDNAVVTTAAESIDPITLADDDVVIPVINKEGSISESSSSSSELEMLNSYFIDEEGSTYDDGKYDDETSCDDEWIRKLPNIPFNTQEFASSSVLPASFCQSESNDNSVATKTVSNEKSNSSVPCIRPNTLAARLSRLRVKRIPEHLHTQGGHTVIDLIDEDKPQEITKSVPISIPSKIADKSSANEKRIPTEFINSISENNTQYLTKKTRVKQMKYAKKTSQNSIEKHTLISSNPPELASLSETYMTYHQDDKLNIKTIKKVSSEKIESKNSDNVDLFNEVLDLTSFNKAQQVVNMVVDSVFKVELGEKIINESMADFSKNVITDDSIEETRQDKNVPNALTTDVLPKFHENVRKNINEINLEPSISNVNVEKKDKNAMGVSYSEILVENEINTSNFELKAENPLNGCSGIDMTNDKSKISIDESHQVEGVINALIIEVLLGLLENVCKSTTEISESSAEILKVKKENRASMDVLPTQPVMVDKSTTANLIEEEVDTSNHELRTKSAIEVSQEVVRISEDVTVQPYPVHLFCSNSFDPSLMEYLSCNYLDFESVEYILPEVNPPSLVHDLCYTNYILRSQLRNEAKKNLNASIESEKRKKPGSCKRPNMSGPDIFFPFPDQPCNLKNPGNLNQQSAFQLFSHP